MVSSAAAPIVAAGSALRLIVPLLLTGPLNNRHHLRGFVYHAARLGPAAKTIEIDSRPRKGSRACCACCQEPAPGHDQLTTRRFEFIPICGYAVLLRFAMCRVHCPRCGVKVEAVPLGRRQAHLVPSRASSNSSPRSCACGSTR